MFWRSIIMKKIIYTLNDVLHVVMPANKSDIEKVLGPLTDEQYEMHVMEKSIPVDAIGVRQINDSDIPDDRVFRDAWCDVTQESFIDIDCEKAKDITLSNVRTQREKLFKPLDDEFIQALEKRLDTSVIALKKQQLRDITNPIKALDATGKVNDYNLLGQLKQLSII